MTTRIKLTLASLRKRAKVLGVLIEADRDDTGWGYWLLNPVTRNGVWADDNFCTSHDEISGKLDDLERERA
jgi:hypothetical protein